MPTLIKGEFSRNVATLLTGTIIAQAIPVAISPILTRLYTPEDFGVLALFLSITAVFSAIACARYDMAVMLPDDDEDAVSVAALSFLLSATLASLLFLLVLFFHSSIAHALGSAEIEPWLFAAPPTIMLLAIFNILKYYNSRNKKYRAIADATIYQSTILGILQVVLGLLKAGAAGLILGQIISSATGNLKLFKESQFHNRLRKQVTTQRIRYNAKRYSDFPKYSMLSILANSLSFNLSNVLISKLFGVIALGHYALVYRVLVMPAGVIGTAVADVFYQRATEEKRTKGSSIALFHRTFKALCLISLPTFTLAYFIAEELFAFVFGEPWRIAGRYAEILVPLFAIRFIVSPLSRLNQVNQQNHVGLAANCILLFVSLAAIIVSHWLGFTVEQMLQLLCLFNSLFYLGFLQVLHINTRRLSNVV